MNRTLNKKIKKRKINLIIPQSLNYNLIIPNYRNIDFNIIRRHIDELYFLVI